MKKLFLLTTFLLAGLFAMGQYTITDEGTAIKITSTAESLSLSKDGLIFQYILPKLYFISNDRMYSFVWTTIDSPDCPTIDSLYTVVEAWLSTTTYTSITGDTITDGTWKTIAGVQTGLKSLTDGTASWTADQDLTGFDTITATGLLKSQGLTFPDPGTSASSGIITLTADNSTTAQTATIQNIYGGDPYLKLSAPVPSGTARGIMELHDENITLFDGTTDVDYTLTVNGKSNDGIITYMEDEDRFDFDNAVKAVSFTDGVATLTLGSISGANLIGADTVTANYFSGTVIGGLYWTDTTAAGGVGIATAFDIADMVEFADTTTKIATDFELLSYQAVSDTSSKDATRYWVTSQAYLTAEADPVFAGDSAALLHFADTTAVGGVGIATAYDLTQIIGSNWTVSVDSIYPTVATLIYNAGGMTIDGAIKLGDSSAITLDGSYGGDLVFDPDLYNVGLGNDVLAANTSGYKNVAIGDSALHSNTTGGFNIATGYQALYSNTTGGFNIATGSGALASNTTGYYNIATGVQALPSNTAGSYNIATGVMALFSNTTGDNNTAFGYQSLYSNTIGYYNTATGTKTLNANTTGYYNTATGARALYRNTTGCANIATGARALYSNTTGDENVAIGNAAGYSNTTDSSNIFIGDSAGYNATSSNKLWIDNSPTATPLIWGDFLNDSLVVNGDLTATGNIQITGDGSPKFQFQVIADTLCSVRVGIDTVRLHPSR